MTTLTIFVQTPAVLMNEYSAMVKDLAPTLGNLWSRWQDEKEYEDFDEYVGVMEKKLAEARPDGAYVLVRGYKAPFGFAFTHRDMPTATYRVTVNSRSMGWKRVK